MLAIAAQRAANPVLVAERAGGDELETQRLGDGAFHGHARFEGLLETLDGEGVALAVS